MRTLDLQTIFFYAWWLTVNGYIFYFEYDFLLLRHIQNKYDFMTSLCSEIVLSAKAVAEGEINLPKQQLFLS